METQVKLDILFSIYALHIAILYMSDLYFVKNCCLDGNGNRNWHAQDGTIVSYDKNAEGCVTTRHMM